MRVVTVVPVVPVTVATVVTNGWARVDDAAVGGVRLSAKGVFCSGVRVGRGCEGSGSELSAMSGWG